ncbi:hypothetical protein BOX15_Mlig001027g5, partial [Macrostomum lignano]
QASKLFTMGSLASTQRQQQSAAETSSAPTASPQSVLVAVDGSLHSQQALEWFHGRPDVDIVLLHAAGLSLCFGAPTAVVPSAADVDLALEDTRMRVARLRQAMLARCDSLAVRCRFRFVESLNPGAAIVAAAEAEKAALVVVGTRGLGNVRRTLLGSVSNYVISHCRVPVMIVPLQNGQQPAG